MHIGVQKRDHQQGHSKEDSNLTLSDSPGIKTKMKYQNIKYKDVAIPDRVRMGGKMAWLDELLGGKEHPGLLVGGSYLVTGEPNAGKTTVTFQMADALQGRGHRLMYYCPEMIEAEMKMMQERLQLEHGFTFVASDTSDSKEDPDDIDALMKIVQGTDKEGYTPDMELMVDFIEMCKAREKERQEHNARLPDYNKQREENPSLPEIKEDEGRVILFVDSIQALAGGRGAALDILKRFVKLNQTLGGVVIFIGQVTKQGVFAGSNQMPHEVTTHLHISVVRNKEDDQVREFETKKNRAGPCNFCWTMLTATGHVGTEVEYEDDDE